MSDQPSRMLPTSPQPQRGFTDATVVMAEGARVGIVTCLLCGAAILLDPRSTTDMTLLHAIWHEEVNHA